MTVCDRTMASLADRALVVLTVFNCIAFVPAVLFARSKVSCHGGVAMDTPPFVITHEINIGCPARMLVGA